MTREELARTIDHTALKPDTTPARVVQLCAEARTYGFASVCVSPVWVELARKELSGCTTKTGTTVGFPLGAAATTVKAFEAERAVAAGAEELDMVIHVGGLKSGDLESVRRDIAAVVEAAGEECAVKVILETCLLTDDEKILACRIAEEAGARFVKTSTGFAAAGATRHDVKLMRRAVGGRLGVKAAGGIKDLATALAMLEAGADRIGCSSSAAIMEELAGHVSKGV